MPGRCKLRMTVQREIILEELRNATTHPTADEVYEMVRRRLPRVSLSTVYRNLELMSEHGIIQKIETQGTQKRFDGNPRRHYHIRCLECGAVADMETPLKLDLDHLPLTAAGFDVTGYRLEFVGLCSGCRSTRDQGKETKDESQGNTH